MLNFETVGTRQRYTLCCRGVCAFPQISTDPKQVFINRKKDKTEEEIIHKKFIVTDETYEFGPLLCGKNRDRYILSGCFRVLRNILWGESRILFAMFCIKKAILFSLLQADRSTDGRFIDYQHLIRSSLTKLICPKPNH